MGARSFSVGVRDVAGNEVDTGLVTVHFTPDGEPPPEDNLPPEVALVSPMANAQLQANGQVTVGVEEHGERIRLVVSDTGIGLTERQIDQFEAL